MLNNYNRYFYLCRGEVERFLKGQGLTSFTTSQPDVIKVRDK